MTALALVIIVAAGLFAVAVCMAALMTGRREDDAKDAHDAAVREAALADACSCGGQDTCTACVIRGMERGL